MRRLAGISIDWRNSWSNRTSSITGESLGSGRKLVAQVAGDRSLERRSYVVVAIKEAIKRATLEGENARGRVHGHGCRGRLAGMIGHLADERARADSGDDGFVNLDAADPGGDVDEMRNRLALAGEHIARRHVAPLAERKQLANTVLCEAGPKALGGCLLLFGEAILVDDVKPDEPNNAYCRPGNLHHHGIGVELRRQAENKAQGCRQNEGRKQPTVTPDQAELKREIGAKVENQAERAKSVRPHSSTATCYGRGCPARLPRWWSDQARARRRAFLGSGSHRASSGGRQSRPRALPSRPSRGASRAMLLALVGAPAEAHPA